MSETQRVINMKAIIPLILFIAFFISGVPCNAHPGPHHQDRQACDCCEDGHCVCRGYHKTGIRFNSSPRNSTSWIEAYRTKTPNNCPCECRSKNDEEKKAILPEGNPTSFETSTQLFSTKIDYPQDSSPGLHSCFNFSKERNPSLRALRTVILLN